MESNKFDLVNLEDELDFISAYYFLLSKRFNSKLSLKFDISSDDLESKIPPMAIQLCVENAVKHNIISSKHPLKIVISSDNHMITISNNLQEKKAIDSHGIGLHNLNKRYQLIANKEIVIYKTDQLFKIQLPVIHK